jgi:hypothetical protein
MFDPKRLWPLVSLVCLLGLFTAQVQCDCDTSANCGEDLDCQGLPWEELCVGHWECLGGACVPVCDQAPECAGHPDCLGKDWPLNDPRLDCTEATGHWECETGVCVAYCNEECNTVSDCMLRAWPEVCAGHWACELGRCRAVCDPAGCGDSACDPAGGETETSCPADCLLGCSTVQECLERDWPAPCQGAWTCVDEACTPRCDYATCGDGTCDGAGGEDMGSCPVDCVVGCRWQADCIDRPWNEICRGHWNCFANACQPICETVRCGDGVCLPYQGESQRNCASDCLQGPCSQPADCAKFPWREACSGRWTCTQGGACDPTCDAGNCADGTCDVLAGETPDSCAADCAGYACTVSEDCGALELPAACSAGSFLCVERVCRPICP